MKWRIKKWMWYDEFGNVIESHIHYTVEVRKRFLGFSWWSYITHLSYDDSTITKFRTYEQALSFCMEKIDTPTTKWVSEIL